MTELVGSGGLIRATYILVFGLSSLACFAGLRRVSRVEHDDTRRGLYWFLAASSGWAAAHVGYVIAPTAGLQYALFVAGLVVGFAAVGPWLYFCSAYTGRTLHRDRTVRRLALGVFALVAGVKITNPIHGAYFSAELATEPFVHLGIVHEPLHWIVMAFAYSLSFVGFFMLFELFVRVDSGTRPLFALVGLTALPVVLDILGPLSPSLLGITHSPLGVAAFSVGLLYVYLERFRVVGLAGESDDPIVVLDGDGRIKEYNQRARRLFPAIADGIGEPVADLSPTLVAAIDSPEALFETEIDGSTRRYAVASNPFSTVRARAGRIVVFTDVNDRERNREKLERQNEQLEQFASVVSHDLRNPLSVAQGWTEIAIESGGTDDLPKVVDAHDRMSEIIEDILKLAREGNSIDEIETLDLATVASESWGMVSAGEASLVVEESASRPIEADSDRLQQLLENLYRNALEHGGHDVTVTVGSLPDDAGFFIEDDGDGIPEADREAVFAAGYSTSRHGTGFGLAIVKGIVDAHDWSIRAVEGRDGGARFEITVPNGN